MDWRTHVRTALDGEHPRIGRSVVLVLYALIIFSTLSISIETLPDLPSWAISVLADAEFAVVGVFTVEYVLRIATAPDRLAYVRSFFGIVDLLAILPFYLSLGVDLRALRAIRLLRLFRLLKIARYSAATRRMGIAIRSAKDELIIFGSCAVFILYLCAIGIYYFEHDAQPEAFSSVFAAMWWAAVTLTTVGYGDVYPVTIGGRVFTVVVLFVALGVIAIPTGVISSAMARLRDEDDGPE
jgi:voltage-gated potassium channel